MFEGGVFKLSGFLKSKPEWWFAARRVGGSLGSAEPSRHPREGAPTSSAQGAPASVSHCEKSGKHRLPFVERILHHSKERSP